MSNERLDMLIRLFAENESIHWQNFDSILEAIYNLYFENQGCPDGLIRECYHAFDKLLDQLSSDHKDNIHNAVADLCTEYERKGFIDGVKTGFNLFLALIK